MKLRELRQATALPRAIVGSLLIAGAERYLLDAPAGPVADPPPAPRAAAPATDPQGAT